MNTFQVSELTSKSKKSNKLYYEFIRIPALSAGLYSIPAGGVDPQPPHTEDEVYYVVGGRARIEVGSESQEVQAGTVILVQAGIEHHFHTVTEGLTVLVFFAPAEYSLVPGREDDEQASEQRVSK